MTVLVTGGSGFIGSHVVDRLLAAGIAPRIFDLIPSPHHDPHEVENVIGDVLDTEALERAMAGCDAVIHLAAAADVEIVVEQPSGSEQTNAQGTLSVLEAARAAGVGRVVYGSTIWVYDGCDGDVVNEQAPLVLPRHIYTASKLAGEMYCTSYAELYDVSFTILRFGIPYGPRARPSAVIPIFVRRALAGEPLTIAGDGLQTRRFVYVEDLADGVVRALARRAVNRIYNLTTDETVTIRELAETMQDVVGDVKIVHVPGRSGDFGGAEVSSLRAKRELGWRASTPLREGVGRYVAWLKEALPVAREEAADAEPATMSTAPGPVGPARPAVVQWARERLFAGVPIAALACAIGTLFPYLLAHRLDEFDTRQADAVALTTLFATIACLSVWQAISARNASHGAVVVGWLAAGYFALLTVPWPKATLQLAIPEIQTLIISALGTTMALAVVAGGNRFREAQGAEAAATDRLT